MFVFPKGFLKGSVGMMCNGTSILNTARLSSAKGENLLQLDLWHTRLPRRGFGLTVSGYTGFQKQGHSIAGIILLGSRSVLQFRNSEMGVSEKNGYHILGSL